MRESAYRREAHLWGEGGAVVSICMRESAHRAERRTCGEREAPW